MTPKEEQNLLNLVVAGDDKAFRGIWDAYRRPVYGYIYNRSPSLNEDDRNQAMAETFVALWDTLRPKSGKERVIPEALSGWLMRVARNKTIDLLRRNKGRESSVEDTYIDRDNNDPYDHLDASDSDTGEVFERWPDVMKTLARKQDAEVMQHCFGKLESTHPKLARAFELFHLEDLSQAEIARELSEVEGTFIDTSKVRKRVFEARAALRKCLTAWKVECYGTD